MPKSTVFGAHQFKVNIVTGKGGGGHYATYRALRHLAEQKQLPWQFQVTDMDDIMLQMTQEKGSINAYKWLGSSVSELYNGMLKRGWTWLWPLQMRLNKLLVKLNADFALNYFKAYWQQQQPDIVVSVVTMCNGVLWQALSEVLPAAPYVTVMIDFADQPPGFWIEPNTDSYIVCGKPRAVEQALSLDVRKDRIVSTSGMVIHPSFSASNSGNKQSSDAEKVNSRANVGLLPDCLTGLVMFGGNGADVMLKIAQKLLLFGDRIQLILLCGHNQPLMTALDKLPSIQRRLIVGYTTEVSKYMAMADFFIGKPGPGSLSEALEMNLPVITERNFSTLVHERYNADWIQEEGMGIVIRSFSEVTSAVEQFMDADKFEHYRQIVTAYENNAVYEVCDLIESLLPNSLPASASAASISTERA